MNRICPQCMSSHIEFSGNVLFDHVDNPVHCNNCKWEGKENELIGVPDAVVAKAATEQGVYGPDQALSIVRQMSQDFLTILASRMGTNFGQALVEVGFVGLNDKKRLARLIRAACLGAMRGVLEEAESLQKEVQS